MDSTFATAHSPAPPTILVVDDDATMRDMISRMLVRSGYPVITAADGVDALSIFRESAIDLIITDMRMPEMNGLDLIRHVRQLRPRALVIGISGADGSTRYLKRARLLGASVILRKPVVRADLVRVVQNVIARTALCATSPSNRTALARSSR